ncbi:hypothetical protein EZS27_012928 [termite gut metagenome]|uniref:Uncharacterized protein n=1 Tax=termite gut metagenome TaxID=433724 RepID=A0A5J4S098_9ZZZZ
MIQKYKFKLCAIIAVYLGLASCVDLDQTPMTSLPGEVYFENETQLQTYVDNLYAPRTGNNTFDQIFDAHGTWSYGTFGIDGNTDNMATVSADNIWIPANYKVTQGGGDWSFTYIYKCNYFFNFVLPKYEAKIITGSVANINHLVGEVYFLRAYEYFKKLQKLGDFPIVTEILPDDMTALTEASKRQPRTEVAHFILRFKMNHLFCNIKPVVIVSLKHRAVVYFYIRNNWFYVFRESRKNVRGCENGNPFIPSKKQFTRFIFIIRIR